MAYNQTSNDDHDDQDDEDSFDFIPKKKCSDIRGCGDLYIYLKQNPRTFVATVTFVTSLTAVLALGVSYAVGFHPNSCFFVAGAAGIVSNLYGFCHFRTLLNLKKEVDEYSNNNKKFAQENSLLTKEVNRFSQAKDGTDYIHPYYPCTYPYIIGIILQCVMIHRAQGHLIKDQRSD